MDKLEEVIMSDLIIDEVDKFRTTSWELIEQIVVVDREVVHTFIADQTTLPHVLIPMWRV